MIREVDYLLFQLSSVVLCPSGWYVAVNVANFQKNRFEEGRGKGLIGVFLYL